jgi:hypothetical protein
MSSPKVGQTVRVRLDVMEHLAGGWQQISDVCSVKRTGYVAVGIVLKVGRHFLTMSPVTNSEDSAHCSYRIPVGAIRSLRRLR